MTLLKASCSTPAATGRRELTIARLCAHSSPAPPTAIFAWNDVVAASILGCAVRLGVAVPHELSIVGYNDFTVAQLTNPPLTTMRQPLFTMGQVTVESLIERIAQLQRNPEDVSPIRHIVPAEFVQRGSCAAPPDGP